MLVDIKVYVNKTLGMSPRKESSQVAHAVAGLLAQGVTYSRDSKIVVLEARNTAFLRKYEDINQPKYMQEDKGLTEILSGSMTAFAYLEDNN